MPKYKHVLFIDPGTSWGWALCEASKEGLYVTVSSGAMTLDGKTYGERALAFWDALADIAPAHLRADMLFAWEEAPFDFRGGSAARVAGGWYYAMTLFCEMHKIAYQPFNQSEIKAYVARQGFYTRRKPQPKKRAGESAAELAKRVRAWEETPFDKKPRPRPEWLLSIVDVSAKNRALRENEVDARWGLEYVLDAMKREERVP